VNVGYTIQTTGKHGRQARWTQYMKVMRKVTC